MSNRDELRQAVSDAIVDTAWGIGNPWPSLADAAIAAYEAHRPRADVVLTREEWDRAEDLGHKIVIMRDYLCTSHTTREVTAICLRAAFPWIRVEGEWWTEKN
jgi:hypothetical protein